MSDIIKIDRTLIDNLYRIPSLAQVYIYLITHADQHGVLDISLREITFQTGLSIQSVRTALKKLEISSVVKYRTEQYKTRIELCGLNQSAKQRTEEDDNKISARSEDGALIKVEEEDICDRIQKYYNNMIAGTSLPRVTKMTESRRRAVKSALKEYDKVTVASVINKAVASHFLVNQWGKVNFDWIFKRNNFLKILEGNYDNTSSTANEQSGRGTNIIRKNSSHTELEAAAEAIIRNAGNNIAR